MRDAWSVINNVINLAHFSKIAKVVLVINSGVHQDALRDHILWKTK